MDDRVREHAETLVDWSARIGADDRVVVSVDEGALDLAVAVAAALGERGADPTFLSASGEVARAYLREHSGGFGDGGHERALYEAADVALSLGGGRNTAAMADVPGDVKQARSRARNAVREARLATDWVSTVHPTRSLAQAAGMPIEAYRDFVYGAILRDWEALAAEMAKLKDRLDAAETVRIVGPETDISMAVAGRTAVNSAASVAYDSHNLPSGEVFTAPYATEGTIRFDVPMTIDGRHVRDLQLTVADGAVTDFEAVEGAEVIEDVLGTDEGARRLGELGIGMNRGIDRVTDNILFDEKMAGTVHLALGRAYDACLPTGEPGNESAVHVDLITRMGDGTRIEIDDEVIQRDGTFWYEDGFAG